MFQKMSVVFPCMCRKRARNGQLYHTKEIKQIFKFKLCRIKIVDVSNKGSESEGK